MLLLRSSQHCLDFYKTKAIRENCSSLDLKVASMSRIRMRITKKSKKRGLTFLKKGSLIIKHRLTVEIESTQKKEMIKMMKFMTN